MYERAQALSARLKVYREPMERDVRQPSRHAAFDALRFRRARLAASRLLAACAWLPANRSAAFSDDVSPELTGVPRAPDLRERRSDTEETSGNQLASRSGHRVLVLCCNMARVWVA